MTPAKRKRLKGLEGTYGEEALPIGRTIARNRFARATIDAVAEFAYPWDGERVQAGSEAEVDDQARIDIPLD